MVLFCVKSFTKNYHSETNLRYYVGTEAALGQFQVSRLALVRALIFSLVTRSPAGEPHFTAEVSVFALSG